MTSSVFAPKSGETFNISATSTSASVTMTAIAAGADNLRIYNAGSGTVFVRMGRGAQTADASNSVPIPAGSVECFFKGGADTVAAVCASGNTATVYFTPGEGA